MKRILCFLLAAFLLAGMTILPASAADTGRSYTLELTVNGEHVVQASPGDVLTVTATLRRTDAQAAAPMYAMQDEIRYDNEFLEIVEGGALTTKDIATTDIALMDGDHAFYVNFLSLTGGTQWAPEVLLTTFQVRVLGESGSTTLKNENVLVSTRDGKDTYQVTVEDLQIVVSGDCVVYFDSYGGSPVEEQLVKFGELLQRPEDPTRQGYIFTGWYTEPTLQNRWSFASDRVRGDMTLYAAWDKDTSAGLGDFDAWGLLIAVLVLLLVVLILLLLTLLGLLILLLLLLFGRKKVEFMVGDTVYHTIKVKRDDHLTLPVPPERPGFRFLGWYTEPVGGVRWDAENDRVSRSIRLYAHWTDEIL